MAEFSYVAESLAWRTHCHFTQLSSFPIKRQSTPATRGVVPKPLSPPSRTLSPVEQLRQQCQQSGIKWRNAHGKHKHLKKQEMLTALKALKVIPLQRHAE